MIAEKLLKIQEKLKAPKGQYNSFGKYYYRSCEDILEAVKPLCVENKVVLQITDSVTEVGNRIYVVATAKLVDVEDNSSTESTGFAREEENKKGMDGAQITGSCSSYARKYALNGLFCIDDTKDPDELPPAEKIEKTDKVGGVQIANLQTLAKQKGVAIEKIVAGYKLNSINDISPQQWAQAMTSLQKRADA